MDDALKEKVRDQFLKYLAYEKIGALNQAAKTIQCNRTHLSLWRDKKRNMSDHFVIALAKFLINKGYIIDDLPHAPGTENPIATPDPVERLAVALRNASLMVVDTAPLNDRLDALEHMLRYVTDKLIPEMRKNSGQ